MQNHEVEFLPQGHLYKVEERTSLKELMNYARIRFDFPCNGQGTCGKCRVKITDGMERPAKQEEKLLTKDELEQGIRLACQIKINKNIKVQLLNEQAATHQILHTSIDAAVKVDPHIRKKYLVLDKPSLSDCRDDWQRIKDAYTALDKSVSVPIHVIRSLPVLLRKANYRLTAVSMPQEVRGLEAGNTAGTLLGMAIDIGTTTMVGYLMDLLSGEEICVVAKLNPQIQYGADVVSRIMHAGSQQRGLEELHFAAINGINELIAEAAAKAAVRKEDIYALTVAGNTCMHHLFLGIHPDYIAQSPYIPAISESVSIDPATVGLEINRAGKVFVLPNIAGFVGADTVAALMATKIHESSVVRLVIDIGTNGEIVLGSKERLTACSAAAGPAFEGAQISCGMRGAAGAIDHVMFGEQLDVTVIGNAPPRGICGSALLDTVAGLLQAGLINRKGKFIEPEEITHPVGIRFRDRLVKYEGAWAFLLAEGAGPRPIIVSQKDIRQLQLAKGAIAAGIQILLNTCGLTADDIQEVLLAGAFGNYLNPHSACTVGLIPKGLEKRVRVVGNAAGAGAKLALLSAEAYRSASSLAQSVDYVELGSDPGFISTFTESMHFPE